MSDPAFLLEDEFDVRPELGCVRRADGAEVPLRPKAFQALVYLVRHRQRLVTKDELAAHLWPETAVTDDSMVQCIVELRKALGDAAKEPRYVRTIPKLGYRFVATVREIADEGGAAVADVTPVATDVPPVAAPSPGFPIWSAAIALIVVIVAGAVMLFNGSARTETAALDPTSGKPGIAVMFLDNQSHVADIDWMRQGLAEMLITGLSRSDRVNVLGRKHLQTLLERVNHPVDREIPLDVAREVARRAHASFMLTGSFVRLGDKTRVDVRIESVDAKQVASETLIVDRPEDMLTEVDLLAWKLARNFDTAVEKPAAMSASGLTTDLEAYRAYSLGLARAGGYHVADAATLFEHALTLDPNFVMARARLGYVYGVTSEQSEKALPYLEAAFKSAERLRESDRLYIETWYAIARKDFAAAIDPLQKIIRLYPYEVEAYDRVARLLLGERRHADAIEAARRGLLVDPESTELHNTLGNAYAYAGRHDDAIAAHRRYVALAPNEPNSHDSLGLSLQAAGRYGEAEASYRQALELKPDFDVAIAHLANVYFQTGRYRLAAALYERYVALAKFAGGRNRGLLALATIRARHGRMTDAAHTARDADAALTTEPPWGMLLMRALSRERLSALPTPEQFSGYANRGSRHSKRSFLWLTAQDALIQGDTPGGLEWLRLMLLENPIYWSIDPYEDGLALAYMELQRWDDAIAEFRRLLRINPGYPRAHYHLALAYERKGDILSARSALQQFLAIWSGADADVPEVLDAKARLARLTS